MVPLSHDPPATTFQKKEEGYENPPDHTPRREGGEDAVAEISENILADEEVIANTPKDNSSDTSIITPDGRA